MDESLEGWYTDPYALHEARWMSAGTPTPLVRDGDVEGHDPAPDEPFKVTPVRLGGNPKPNGGVDLRRADDGEREDAYDSNNPAPTGWARAVYEWADPYLPEFPHLPRQPPTS